MLITTNCQIIFTLSTKILQLFLTSVSVLTIYRYIISSSCFHRLLTWILTNVSLTGKKNVILDIELSAPMTLTLLSLKPKVSCWNSTSNKDLFEETPKRVARTFVCRKGVTVKLFPSRENKQENVKRRKVVWKNL